MSLNIGYMVPYYFPKVGGVENVVKNIAERITEFGNNVFVYCLRSDNSPRREEINGVLVRRFRGFSPNEAYHFPSPRMLEKVQKRSFDVLHVHNLHSITTLGAYLLRKKMENKFVITPYYHGTGHSDLAKILWKPYRLISRKILKTADAVIVVSELERKLIYRDFGVDPSVIENGVDRAILGKKWGPDGNVVLYSGRLTPHKNVDRLIRIMEILRRRYGFDGRLEIVGEGPQKNKLGSLAENSSINCVMKSFLPREEYIENIRNASALALISSKESYPQSINEAHAMGVPTITASPWGENFEDRPRNLIVKMNWSDNKIANKIWNFLKETPKQPRPTVPSWEEVAQTYLKNYKICS